MDQRITPLYDRDFYLWTQAEAEKLRRAAEARLNLDLDFDNLAEEVESMGRSEWRGVQSALARIIEHLLKLEYSSAPEPRRGWLESVLHHRADVEEALDGSPSLEGRLDLERSYERGRAFAEDGLGRFGELPKNGLPDLCPYTLGQMLDRSFIPPNRYGLTD